MNEKLRINSKKYKFGKFEGITLISLVITIIILIILAGVAVNLSIGENGIFRRAKEANEVTNKQEATDIINLKITTAQMNKYAEKQQMPTLQELADVLYEDNEIEYIALETKIGSKEKITVGEKTSIFTKLNNYPYEFEINSSLQLASIDGVKIAANSNKKSEKEVIWEGNTNGLSEIEVNWKPYSYIIFYYNDYSNEPIGSLTSKIFDVDTINLLQNLEVEQLSEKAIQLNGYNNYYIHLIPTDSGFTIQRYTSFYIKRIVGIY